MAWLISLSDSKIRAFRHTSTLTLYLIMDSLIETLKEFRANLSTIEKQLKAAKKKKDKKAQSELSTRSDELQERTIKIDGAITNIFER